MTAPSRPTGVARAALVVALLLGVAACEGAADPPGDAGGGADSGTVDGGRSDVAPPDTGGPDAGSGDGGSERDGALDTAPAAPPMFTVAFDGAGRRPENQGQRETWLIRSDGTGLRSLGGEVVAAGGPVAGCAHGCVLAADGARLAVAEGPPDLTGSADWQIAERSGDTWAFDGAARVESAATLAFTTAGVLYARPTASDGVFELRRRTSGPAGEDALLFSFPPNDAVAGSLFRGTFHADAAGETIALLRPTLRSERLYVWRASTGAVVEVDEACWRTVGGACQGAGSFYEDDDPLAVSADGGRIAWFVVSDSRLELRHHELATDARTVGTLAAIPEGVDWSGSRCDHLGPGDLTGVAGRPRFADGDTTLLFVGRADCSDRPETDAYQIPVTALPGLSLADLANLTQTPKTGGPEQLLVADLTLGPEERTLVLAASPTTSGGQPIPPASSRHERDTEIWVQLRDGGGADRRQLTDDAAFSAERPRTFLP